MNDVIVRDDVRIALVLVELIYNSRARLSEFLGFGVARSPARRVGALKLGIDAHDREYSL